MATSQEELNQSLQEYTKKKILLQVINKIRSGKEAVVYLASNQNNQQFALKVYKNSQERSFKHTEQYLAGRYFHSLSLKKAVAKKNRYGQKILNHIWIQREFYLLEIAYKAGVNVPRPISYTNNSILMEFIGKNGVSASRLSDIVVTVEEKEKIQKKLLDDIEILKKNGLVHGDLSAFNVLMQEDKPYIIDFPQTLDIRNNPNWEDMYNRDIFNIKKYFQKK